MEALQSSQVDLPRPSNRKVWVLNWFHLPYREEFRGTVREIPAKDRKDPALNLWNIMEAERFLGVSKPPAQQAPDGTWIGQPKSLRIAELTEEEVEKYERRSVADRKKEIKAEEAAIRFSCPICSQNIKTEAALKRHTTMMHPEFEPVKSNPE